MKKCLFCVFSILAAAAVNAASLEVIDKGEGFEYPLKDGDTIACYAKRVDGSVTAFNEYNDYFVMKNGKLYSNTMQAIYKPKKADKLKKVDRVRMIDDKTLTMYDPLWEWSFRHHIRRVKINTKTGEYYMNGMQDNWTWYRNITATGLCKVVKN